MEGSVLISPAGPPCAWKSGASPIAAMAPDCARATSRAVGTPCTSAWIRAVLCASSMQVSAIIAS